MLRVFWLLTSPLSTQRLPSCQRIVLGHPRAMGPTSATVSQAHCILNGVCDGHICGKRRSETHAGMSVKNEQGLRLLESRYQNIERY